MLSDNAPPGRIVFSEKFACPVSGFTIAEIEPRLFSFNAPQGACPACDGLGEKLLFDEDLVVPNEALSRSSRARSCPGPSRTRPALITCRCWAQPRPRVSTSTSTTPWNELPEEVRRDHPPRHRGQAGHPPLRRRPQVLRGEEAVRGRDRQSQPPHAADRERLDARGAAQATSPPRRARPAAAPASARAARGQDRRRGHLHVHPPLASPTRSPGSPPSRTSSPRSSSEIARAILKEINERLGFLNNVGLDYLNLDRTSGTLSGGESQRIRLASQIGSGLSGVLYVLDEPSIGLHQSDNDRLLETLKRLRDLGNTVLVVEHDEDAIRPPTMSSTWAPAPASTAARSSRAARSTTCSPARTASPPTISPAAAPIAVPAKRRKGNGQKLTVHGARANNLQDVTAAIPLGTFTCITGVSGSGKSSFTIDTLYAAAARALNGARILAGPHEKITGLEYLDKVIDIDQSPIGRTPRSNPATYTGAFTQIRDWFAGLPESQARGYKPGRFSFNVKGGRCEACKGDGLIKIEMHFLPDVYVTCDVCHGHRYNRETLEVKFKGRSIADVLDMTVEDAAEFFKAVPAIRDKMAMLEEVGLGYIKVGQQATTLRGGEAQRVKLAKELSRRATGQTLYILDEPTTGLHFEDVRKLLEVLHALVEQGNTVVVIEHNLDVIKTADWVLDLGPEGGDKGGEIVAEGTPEAVADDPRSYTGHYLAPLLRGARAAPSVARPRKKRSTPAVREREVAE